MCIQILDPETLARVKAAAPKEADSLEGQAKQVVKSLADRSTPEKAMVGLNGEQYWRTYLGDLSDGLPDYITPHRLGRLCRGMGLTLHRRNIGYQVAWSGMQIGILRGVFGV